jgi:dihydrodipicolinate synthase/N-acetylneuraminate lyase
MAQPDFYTMRAIVFARGGSFDEDAMRLYLKRQIDARLGVYLGSGGNGETHAMLPDELFRLYAVGVEEYARFLPLYARTGAHARGGAKNERRTGRIGTAPCSGV